MQTEFEADEIADYEHREVRVNLAENSVTGRVTEYGIKALVHTVEELAGGGWHVTSVRVEAEREPFERAGRPRLEAVLDCRRRVTALEEER